MKAAPSNAGMIVRESSPEDDDAKTSDGGSVDDLPISPGLGCLVSLLAGLIGALIVFQTIKLAAQGEIRLGGGELTPNRIWVVREGDIQGLGWSTGRVVAGSRSGPRVCVRTKVSFLLWRADGPAQPADFCDCFQRSGGGWQPAGACPSESDP